VPSGQEPAQIEAVSQDERAGSARLRPPQIAVRFELDTRGVHGYAPRACRQETFQQVNPASGEV
jgi:hypothetical protein